MRTISTTVAHCTLIKNLLVCRSVQCAKTTIIHRQVDIGTGTTAQGLFDVVGVKSSREGTLRRAGKSLAVRVTVAAVRFVLVSTRHERVDGHLHSRSRYRI